MTASSVAKTSPSYIDIAPIGTTLVRPVPRVCQVGAPFVDSYSPKKFSKSILFLKKGIYPFLRDGEMITFKVVKDLVSGKIKNIPLIHPENFIDLPDNQIIESFFDEINPSEAEKEEHLINIISDTFYYRLGYRPRNPFNVDDGMFIFPGGFISLTFGNCGDWKRYIHIFHRWNIGHWSPYPYRCDPAIRDVIKESVNGAPNMLDNNISVITKKLNVLKITHYFEKENCDIPTGRRFKLLWLVIIDEKTNMVNNYNITSISNQVSGREDYVLHNLRNVSIESILRYSRPKRSVQCPHFGPSLLEGLHDKLTKKKLPPVVENVFSKIDITKVKPFIPTIIAPIRPPILTPPPLIYMINRPVSIHLPLPIITR